MCLKNFFFLRKKEKVPKTTTNTRKILKRVFEKLVCDWFPSFDGKRNIFHLMTLRAEENHDIEFIQSFEYVMNTCAQIRRCRSPQTCKSCLLLVGVKWQRSRLLTFRHSRSTQKLRRVFHAYICLFAHQHALIPLKGRSIFFVIASNIFLSRLAFAVA